MATITLCPMMVKMHNVLLHGAPCTTNGPLMVSHNRHDVLQGRLIHIYCTPYGSIFRPLWRWKRQFERPASVGFWFSIFSFWQILLFCHDRMMPMKHTLIFLPGYSFASGTIHCGKACNAECNNHQNRNIPTGVFLWSMICKPLFSHRLYAASP